jgi:20S proteasome subunit beta 2
MNPSREEAPAGFNFENVRRNAVLTGINEEATEDASKRRAVLPGATKTGTTIVGVVYRDGVVLGADTRATAGSTVAEKKCVKIHYLAPNIYCCGAGTAADTEHTNALISSQLELLRMETHAESRVVTACTLLKRLLFRYQGYISAALILGGCDANGPHLYQIYPHGSTGKLPYTTMGSGSLAAMSVFESAWKADMSEQEAVDLVQRAVTAGIFNDLGSGSNCDVCVVRTDRTVDLRLGAVQPNELGPLRAAVRRSGRFAIPAGATPVLAVSHRDHPTLADVTVTEMEVES